jgi:hypothetical protein
MIMAETYHGVPIPDDLWQDWNDPYAEGPKGFCRGVLAALLVAPGSPADASETVRLGVLASARDAADQAAWEARRG